MGADKLENHMVIGADRHQADELRKATQIKIELASKREAIVRELAGAVDNAVTDLKDAGDEPKILEGFVNYLDRLAGMYEAEAEVGAKELDFLTRNLGSDDFY